MQRLVYILSKLILENPVNSKIEVISSSETVAFVKVGVKKIINPGTPHEKELEVEGLDRKG